MPARIGLDAALRRGTVGAAIASTTVVNNVKDLTLSMEKGEGVLADWTVTGFSIEQPLEEAQTVNVTCKPTYVTRAPVWHTPA